jgi:hypothetical protein
MPTKLPQQSQPPPQQRRHGPKFKLSLTQEDALKKANVENKKYSLISDKPNK